MKLCSQSEGTLPSRMIAAARSRIMEAPMSPAARIISTTMPDGPGALPAFICEIVIEKNQLNGQFMVNAVSSKSVLSLKTRESLCDLFKENMYKFVKILSLLKRFLLKGQNLLPLSFSSRSGQMVSTSLFGLQVPEFESWWRRNSAHYCMAFHFTETHYHPSIILT